MKLTIPKSDLVKGLTIVKNAAATKGSVAILGNVAIAALARSIELACSDLDIGVRTRIDAAVTDKGDCTVNARMFCELVHSFPGSEVCLEALSHDLRISCGESRYKLGTLPTSELPPTPKLKDPTTFELPQHLLHRLLAETSFCHGEDEARMLLCGSLLEVNGAVTVASTDGRRLAVEEETLESKLLASSAIIPAKTVRELLRLLNSKAPETGNGPLVKVRCSTNLIQFEFNDTTMTSKLIEGKYPDYRKVIPSNLDTGIPVGRADLLGALQRVHIVSDSSTLQFAGQSLTIRGRGTKECPGEAVETLLIPKTKTMEMSFSTKYLIEALQAIDDDQILIFAKGPNFPAVFKTEKKAWTCVTAAMSDKQPAKPAEPKPESKQPELAKK